MKMKKVWKILCIIVMVPAFIALVGFVTMSLWNWLVPSLFAGPLITFWQALGLLVLSRILIGFPKGGGERGCSRKKRMWKEKMQAKMEHLSPEEKEKMKDAFSRCMSSSWGRKTQKDEQE